MIEPDQVGGGSVPALIRETAAASAGSLPEISADSPASEPAHLIDALRLWLRNDDLVASGAPVAFVVVDSLRDLDGDEVLLLSLPNDRALVPGTIYFCSHGLGKAVRVPGGNSIDELASAIGTMGFSDRPTVIYMPIDSAFAWLPRGLSEPDDRLEERLHTVGRDVDEAELLEVLDRIYREHWRTPTAGGRIWHHADGRVPVRDAEAVFQADVFLVCKMLFSSHKVIAEVTDVVGRCDILLLPRFTAPQPQGRAVIEMKVLRAFHFPASGGIPGRVPEIENKKAVRKGVGQALFFGNEHLCETRILCICDMRLTDDDAVEQPFVSFGVRHAVVTRRYFMYASADEIRENLLDSMGMPPA